MLGVIQVFWEYDTLPRQQVYSVNQKFLSLG